MAKSTRRNAPFWVALIAVLGPPVAWTISNTAIAWSNRNDRAVWSAPLTYLFCVVAMGALLILITIVVRRRSISELAWLVALSGASNTLALVLALAAPLAMTTGRATLYEPTPVVDRTSFAKTYHDLRGGFPGAGEYVSRHSWALNEFGVVPPDISASGLNWVGYWEEYGLPFRCARSALHFGLPRPDRSKYISLLPHILSQLRIRPIALTANALLLAVIVLACLRLPRWVIARHRSQADCCPACGYFVRDLRRCPECGTDVRRHRRGVTAA
jgi:hypothetical protein